MPTYRVDLDIQVHDPGASAHLLTIELAATNARHAAQRVMGAIEAMHSPAPRVEQVQEIPSRPNITLQMVRDELSRVKTDAHHVFLTAPQFSWDHTVSDHHLSHFTRAAHDAYERLQAAQPAERQPTQAPSPRTAWARLMADEDETPVPPAEPTSPATAPTVQDLATMLALLESII